VNGYEYCRKIYIYFFFYSVIFLQGAHYYEFRESSYSNWYLLPLLLVSHNPLVAMDSEKVVIVIGVYNHYYYFPIIL